MKIFAQKYCCLIILTVVMILTHGCSGSHYGKSGYSSPSYSPPVQRSTGPPPPPDPIDIMITIKDWKIVQHRIMGASGRLGDIRFAGRFLFIDDLVFKLKAEREPDWYWLVKIPSIEAGIYEIRAKPYREYSQNLKPIEAPEQFKISIRIQNRVIKDHYVVDPDPRWGKFQTAEYQPPVVYLKNEQYAGRVWAAKLPGEDGTWTIYITLVQ